MGEGLKRVAKRHGGLIVTDGKTTVRYDADGKMIGPYGCRCKTLREKCVGDGCEICNPEKARELDEGQE